MTRRQVRVGAALAAIAAAATYLAMGGFAADAGRQEVAGTDDARAASPLEAPAKTGVGQHDFHGALGASGPSQEPPADLTLKAERTEPSDSAGRETASKGAFLDPDHWTPGIDSNGTTSFTGEFMNPDEDAMDWASIGPPSDTGPFIAVEPE